MLKGSVTEYFPGPWWESVLHDLENATLRWLFGLEKCSMSHFVSLGSLHRVWPGDEWIARVAAKCLAISQKCKLPLEYWA